MRPVLYDAYQMCDTVRVFGTAPALSSASSTCRYDAFYSLPAVGCGYHVRSAHSLLSVANSGATPLAFARFGSAPRARNVMARSYWPLTIATTIGVDRSPSVGTLTFTPASRSAIAASAKPSLAA